MANQCSAVGQWSANIWLPMITRVFLCQLTTVLSIERERERGEEQYKRRVIIGCRIIGIGFLLAQLVDETKTKVTRGNWQEEADGSLLNAPPPLPVPHFGGNPSHRVYSTIFLFSIGRASGK